MSAGINSKLHSSSQCDKHIIHSCLTNDKSLPCNLHEPPIPLAPQIPRLTIDPHLVAETSAASVGSTVLNADKPVYLKPAVVVFHFDGGSETLRGELNEDFDVDAFHLITNHSIPGFL